MEETRSSVAPTLSNIIVGASTVMGVIAEGLYVKNQKIPGANVGWSC